nr:ribonuclease P protein component [Pseudactinotalea sp. HY160]
MPARYRMRGGDEFSETVRRGTRAGGRHVVAHILTRSTHADAARVGFVVSKSVGNAVRRNLVKRRLRALMATRVERYAGRSVVVRALAGAADASFADLDSDLGRCLARAEAKAGGRR